MLFPIQTVIDFTSGDLFNDKLRIRSVNGDCIFARSVCHGEEARMKKVFARWGEGMQTENPIHCNQYLYNSRLLT